MVVNIFPNLFLNISLAIKASKSSNCIMEREREREREREICTSLLNSFKTTPKALAQEIMTSKQIFNAAFTRKLEYLFKV
jgi:hypothetical protein